MAGCEVGEERKQFSVCVLAGPHMQLCVCSHVRVQLRAGLCVQSSVFLAARRAAHTAVCVHAGLRAQLWAEEADILQGSVTDGAAAKAEWRCVSSPLHMLPSLVQLWVATFAVRGGIINPPQMSTDSMLVFVHGSFA